MIYNGTFNFKKIIGDRGYYAEIEIEVQLANSKGNVASIILNYTGEQEWKISLLYGVELFLNHCWKKDSYNLTVTIKKWNWLPQDTTLPIASFVMLKALGNALNISTDIFTYDQSISSFILKPS